MQKHYYFLMTFMLFFFSSLLPAEGGTSGSIAYLKSTEDFWQVWLMDADGSHHRQLTKDSVDKVNLSCSDDGRKLIYNTNLGRIFLLNLEKEKITEIPIELDGIGKTDGDISPNGKELIFSVSATSPDANKFWASQIDGSGLRKVTDLAGFQHDPVWTPDGERIIFLSGANRKVHDIWIVDSNGKDLNQLTIASRYNFEPDCSRDNIIAFSSNRTGNYEIWRMDLEGEKLKRLTNDPAYDSQPTWSPDGKKIAFISNRSGYPEIWVMDKEGKNLKLLTNFKGDTRSPAWCRSIK